MAGGSPEGKSGGGSPYQSMTSRGLAGSPLHAARLPTDAGGFCQDDLLGCLGGRWLGHLLRARVCLDGAHGGLGRRPRALI